VERYHRIDSEEFYRPSKTRSPTTNKAPRTVL
jgi:hypothetical protein